MSAAYGISGENNLVLQTAPIPKLPNDLSVTVRGVGCALVQVGPIHVWWSHSAVVMFTGDFIEYIFFSGSILCLS